LAERIQEFFEKINWSRTQTTVPADVKGFDMEQ